MYKAAAVSLICIIACTSLNCCAQATPAIRYRDPVFDYITVQENVRYYTPGGKTKTKYYLADVYEPYNDTAEKRPLIIWLHGGGFKFGNKQSGGIPLWSRLFASRGYVCAAINYRLNKEKPVSDYKALVGQCMLAINDLQRAVSFFKQHQASYKIDTNCIILAGNSAGGMIALQAVYSSLDELRRRVDPEQTNSLSAVHNPLNIQAVVNFWGALFDINWLQNENVPIVSVHGKRDRIVAITTKDSLFFGSSSIRQEADKLGIPNTIKVYDKHAHELQKIFFPIAVSNAQIKKWREAGAFAAGFLYTVLFRP